MDFLTSFVSVGLLIVLAAPGYFLRKFNMVPENFVGGLVTLLLYVCAPFLTIASFMQTSPARSLYIDMAVVFILGFVLLLAALLVSRLFFLRMRDGPERRVCIAAGFLNNSSFMGIPVLQTFYPGNTEMIIYVSMYVVAFNILSWTILVYTITGEKKYMRLKAAFINPGMISFIVAFAIMALGIPVPRVAGRAIRFFADMTTPVSMLVIGARFADIKMRELLHASGIFLSSFVKLIAVPLCALGFLLVIKPFLSAIFVPPPDPMVYNTLFILSAMPSAAYVIAFCELFRADKAAAVKCVVLSSLLSVLTIPVMMLLITALGKP
jgi:predicted permease